MFKFLFALSMVLTLGVVPICHGFGKPIRPTRNGIGGRPLNNLKLMDSNFPISDSALVSVFVGTLTGVALFQQSRKLTQISTVLAQHTTMLEKQGEVLAQHTTMLGKNEIKVGRIYEEVSRFKYFVGGSISVATVAGAIAAVLPFLK